MEKKVVMTALILGIIIIIVIIAVNVLKKPEAKYPTDPKEWVVTQPDGKKVLVIDYVTQGSGYLIPAMQQYYDKKKNIATAFSYDGIYLGDPFYGNKYYSDEDELKFEITPDLNPVNGIIEGIIVMKINNQEDIDIFVFVDEDWKKQVGLETNIIWGANYEFVKPFEFNQISQGIYMDHIKDDASRCQDNFKICDGGIIVGRLSADEFKNDQLDQAIYMRAI